MDRSGCRKEKKSCPDIKGEPLHFMRSRRCHLCIKKILNRCFGLCKRLYLYLAGIAFFSKRILQQMGIAFDQMKGCFLIQMEICSDILVILFQTDVYGAKVLHFQMEHQTELLRVLL